jgi:proteasome lid subunit RPN8/RPN11
MNDYIETSGKIITVAELKNEYTIEFVEAIMLNPFVSFVEVKRDIEESEIVVIDVVVEIPQKIVNDIRNIERLEIIFEKDNKFIPLVLSLRKDFPLVPHLNLKKESVPKSLCLYGESFQELQLSWSSFSFLERIREWLSLTAKGNLHLLDQPLEPFMVQSNSYLVLPTSILQKSFSDIISVKNITSFNSVTYIAQTIHNPANFNLTGNIIITLFIGEPQVHGIIDLIPQNILELNILLKKAKINIIEELRERLKIWHTQNIGLLSSELILLVDLPKTRNLNSNIESIECLAFRLKKTIDNVGIELGVFEKFEKNYGLLFPFDTTKLGKDLEIEMLNPIETFTKHGAKIYNNNTINDIKITAIGLGTLGSQIYNNLLRQGFTNWALVDQDILLPHNLARHILTKFDIGKHKVISLSEYANNLFDDCKVAYYTTNMLNGIAQNVQLTEDLNSSNLILDMSASVPVARSLSIDIESKARRVSLFTNPKGNDLIILAEDQERMQTLDCLEMQYYRGLLLNKSLFNHLEQKTDKIRYSNSCRDISSRIVIEEMAIFGGIGSSEIKKLRNNLSSSIQIWRRNENGSVEKIEIPTSLCHKKSFDSWTLMYDEEFIKKIYELRKTKLPSETGGVLIGSYDTKRKIIYVVDTIPSPPDSIEWPTVYIRGIKGLNRELENVKMITANMLVYIGEWHSHPAGCVPLPSREDYEAFQWLTEVLHENGKPSLMLIAGEGYAFYLGKMEKI